MNRMTSIAQNELESVPVVNGVSGPPSSFSHRDRLVPVLLFVVSFTYLAAFRHYSSLEPDEGIALQGAERILRGEVPYRDFFSFYTPGSFYLVAFLFRIFGDSLVVARTSLAAAGAVCAVITYLLTRRVCSRSIALFSASLTTVAGFAYRFLVLHNWYSTLLACLTVYAAVRLLESQKICWAFATGCFASLTVLFEQSKGAGLCLGLAMGLVSLRMAGQEQLSRRSEIAGILGGFFLPFLGLFAYFGAQHGQVVMLQDWLWPLRHYTQANHVPYGWQNWSDSARTVIFYTGPVWTRLLKILAVSPGFIVPGLPLVGVGLFGYSSMRMRSQEAALGHCSYSVLISAVLSGLLLSVVIVRADIIHFMYLAPLWYVLLGWLLGSSHLPSPALAKVRPYLIAYVSLTFGMMALAVLLTATGARNRIDTRRGSVMTGDKDTVIEYVQSRVAPEQEMLVYPYLPLYNYLTATRSPSAYDYFQAGMHTPEQAEEIIAALRAHRIRAVLFEPWFSNKFSNSWAGTPLRTIANDPIADYILRNYRVCRLLNSGSGWRFEFMAPSDAPCP
jgi:hypothetical protein